MIEPLPDLEQEVAQGSQEPCDASQQNRTPMMILLRRILIIAARKYPLFPPFFHIDKQLLVLVLKQSHQYGVLSGC
jgi:hypothetical protein